MDFYTKSIDETVKLLDSDKINGLSAEKALRAEKLYGRNVFKKKKKTSVFNLDIDAMHDISNWLWENG